MKKEYNIEKRINKLKGKVDKLDYNNGIKKGIDEYNCIMNEITKIKKTLTIVNKGLKKKATKIIDIDTDNKYIDSMKKIKEISYEIMKISNVDMKIKLFNEMKILISSCKTYHDNLKIDINTI